MEPYETLTCILSLLKNMQISTTIFDENNIPDFYSDLGLRSSILKMDFTPEHFQQLICDCRDNILYQITDYYYCCYNFFKIPGTPNPKYLLIGPYTFENIDDNLFHKYIEETKIPPQLSTQVKIYYENLPYIFNENIYNAILHTLAEIIWDGFNFTICFVKNDLWNDQALLRAKYIDLPIQEKPSNRELSYYATLKEQHYEVENQLMQLVAQGNLERIDILMYRLQQITFEKRLPDPIRDQKNYLIVLNTLLRKAAETGGVHPLHIDSISSTYAKKLEKITGIEMAKALQIEMAYKYCYLVKDHSIKGYSHLIQKVITQIDIDLTADLSLKALSTLLNINSSYLSTLFKKETGVTLTDYVSKKRIDYAIILLATTTMQIQTVACHCGIDDLNYFTKLFKKYMSKTPSEYRLYLSIANKNQK